MCVDTKRSSRSHRPSSSRLRRPHLHHLHARFQPPLFQQRVQRAPLLQLHPSHLVTPRISQSTSSFAGLKGRPGVFTDNRYTTLYGIRVPDVETNRSGCAFQNERVDNAWQLFDSLDICRFCDAANRRTLNKLVNHAIDLGINTKYRFARGSLLLKRSKYVCPANDNLRAL